MEGTMATIMLFGGTFAPRTWAFCHGQLISVSANSALFSLLGTQFGGDGRTTFGLPDLRGRVAVGAGNGPGLTPRPAGAKWGAETTTLTVAELPPHNHPAQLSDASANVQASSDDADQRDPSGRVLAMPKIAEFGGKEVNAYADTGTDTMAPAPVSGNVAVGSTGAGQPFYLSQPSQAIHYIICQQGTYPSRS